jgi:hypothetical protein
MKLYTIQHKTENILSNTFSYLHETFSLAFYIFMESVKTVQQKCFEAENVSTLTGPGYIWEIS